MQRFTTTRLLTGCILGLGAALSLATPARAETAQNRYGWIVNPTPQNWWLNDRDGQ